jgi:CRP/FNR family transcriptional regulator, cyclic AMP receptor protein
MAMDDPLTRLHKISIFGALKTETLKFLFDRATRVEAQPGDVLVRESEPGGDLYILESGTAEVFKERHAPKPIRAHLAELVPGDCFGETSLLACTPRTASVAAVTPCTVLRLKGTDLLELYHHDVQQFAILMMNLGRETARRLWLANERLVDRLLD